MSVFAVCSHFIENCHGDKDFLIDVLYRFIQVNPLRVSIDAPGGQALALYEDAIKKTRSQDLKKWLRLLGRASSKNVEFITIESSNLSQGELFVEIARSTLTQQCVIVWSLQDYKGNDTSGVELIERHDASDRVRQFDKRSSSSQAPEVKSAEGKIMIQNYFSGIQGSTIVVDSLVEKSFNKLKSERSEEVAHALLQIANYVNKSNKPDAGAILNSFNEEIAKPEPQKPVLKSLWRGLLEILPDITTMAEAVSKVTSIFQ
jgi:hypothetical protein